MNHWFRMYEGVVDDPKVQRLPGDKFKAWVNLLCLAARHGGVLPSVADIAYSLRVTEPKVHKIIADFIHRELLDDISGQITPHNWNGRQFKSDTSNERVKHHRERKRNVTPLLTATPSEQKQIQTKAEADLPTAAPAKEFDWFAFGEQVCQAAKIDPKRMANETGTVTGWARAGYSPHTILDVVAHIATRPNYTPKGGLAYFERAIAERHAVKKLPGPPSGDEKWTAALEHWRRDGTWLGSWGPKPGEPGCKVPADLLEQKAA